jgi:hypothetical protein
MQAYGKRNSTEDVILVRVKPIKIIVEKDIATWERQEDCLGTLYSQ